MMNSETRSKLLIVLLFPLAGLFLLGCCFMVYFGVFSVFSSILKEQMPVGFIRQMFAFTLVLIYLSLIHI